MPRAVPRRQHFDSGHGKPEHTFSIEDRGEDFHGSERFEMRMDKPDFPRAAWVTYDTFIEDTGLPTLEVSYLKSNEVGKGNAKKLMQHVYDTYPKHSINWGHTVHPAATHLASQFEDKYYNRTSYYTDEDF